MGMLTKEDLKQIGEVLDEKMDAKFVKFEERVVDRIVGDVGEAFEQNFLPRVDEMIDEKLAPIHGQIVGINGRLTHIETAMVTKSYLDEKLGVLKGDLIGYDRKLERKTDALIDTLAAHGTLISPDLERLESSRVFPHLP